MILIYTTGMLEKTRKNREYSKARKFVIMLVACALAFGVAFLVSTTL